MPNEQPLSGDSIAINRRYLDHLLVEGRIVGAEHPTARVHILGRTFDTPVMTAALSHLKPGIPALAEAARLAGAACCIGMGGCEEMKEALATGAGIIKIIKPYAAEEEIMSRLACAEENGALAVGMDVEHAVNVTDDRDSVVLGLPMKLPSLDDLKRFVRAARLPFLVKGALSVRDAEVCRDLGCAGVILSHHNGLLRWAVPPAMMAREIRRRLGKDFLVIVDGGIQDGFDAFKALALGADAVSVGRPLMEPLASGGPEAAAAVLRRMTDELKAMMVRTGSPDPEHIDPSVIHEVSW